HGRACLAAGTPDRAPRLDAARRSRLAAPLPLVRRRRDADLGHARARLVHEGASEPDPCGASPRGADRAVRARDRRDHGRPGSRRCARRRPGRPRLRRRIVSFAHPLFLLTLLVVPAVLAAYLLVQRRRARFAVRFTNLDVLGAVVHEQRSWRRWVAPLVFLLALAGLCV